jgi:hypothetical protein
VKGKHIVVVSNRQKPITPHCRVHLSIIYLTVDGLRALWQEVGVEAQSSAMTLLLGLISDM